MVVFLQLSLSLFLLSAGKKDGDDGSSDQVDIPKRTAPAKGKCVSFLPFAIIN